MTTEMLLPLFMRWLHIVSAVVGAGGTLFMAFVAMPTVEKQLRDETREKFRKTLMRRWKMVLHPTIVLFLISGFYNYIVVSIPVRAEQPLYHMLFGVKFLLALAFFGVAIVATSTMGWSEKLRQRGGLWRIQVLLALLVVLLGGVMKTLPPKAEAAETRPAESARQSEGSP